jgi:hypothetical protein
LAGTDFTIEPTAEVTAAAAPDLRALHLVMAWALIPAVTVYPGHQAVVRRSAANKAWRPPCQR